MLKTRSFLTAFALAIVATAALAGHSYPDGTTCTGGQCTKPGSNVICDDAPNGACRPKAQ